ncbi:hypothetical protein GCM10018954_055710 [Kutzneria kofuensis]
MGSSSSSSFRLGRQHSGQREPGLLAARDRPQWTVTVKMADAQRGHRRRHLGVGPVAVALFQRREQFPVRGEADLVSVAEMLLCLGDSPLQVTDLRQRGVDRVTHCRRRRQVQHLAEMPDAAGRSDDDLAVVRSLLAGDQPEQRGLAGTVVADDADALAGTDRRRDGVQDPTVGKGLTDRSNGELS